MEKVLAKEIINKLEELKSDEDFIGFQEKLLKTNLKVIGVRVPVLRELAKIYFKSGKIIEFNEETDKYFEGVLLEGLIISLIKEKSILKDKLNQFFYKMDNWAVVDMVCSSLCAFKKSFEKEDFEYFLNLIESKDEFTARFGIVALMKFFINKECLDELLIGLNNIKCEKYYVNMAIAWLISEILIKNSQNVEKIMQKIFKINHFNKFVINKSIQKALESCRINNETKQVLRRMKM